METNKSDTRFRGAEEAFGILLGILRQLRSPEGGCPWDIRQRKEDISRYLIEEAYELVEAIEGSSPVHQCEEMGDLLFQILFLARISEEKGEFDISRVLQGIAEKMIRRHPHVFKGEVVETVGEVKANWERIKEELEHKKKPAGILSGVSKALPALIRAQRITEKAAEVGFDWERIGDVLLKIEEEIRELKGALESRKQPAVKEEIGDILFSVVNLSRFAGVDAEEALRNTVEKFMKRFEFVEKELERQGKPVKGATLEEMDRLWDEAKGKIE